MSRQTKKWASDKWLAEYYDVSRFTIWGWVKSGRLPKPEKLGPNTTRWDFEKVLEADKMAVEKNK